MTPRRRPLRAPDFWGRRDAAAGILLAPLGSLYAAAGTLHRLLVRPCRAPVPVVCVGNLVAGGAGKTPVAISLAQLLRAAGADTHIVSRGYGGREAGPLRVDPARHGAADVGDEPLLLALAAPTWIARDRPAGVEAAAAAGARIVLLDDGLQNPALIKDLAFAVVDGGYGFGNGRVMPAGPLREPVGRGLARADAAVLLGRDSAGVGPGLAERLPLLTAHLVPGPDADRIAGRPVLAFAGIGRPAKFFETLAGLGCRLVATHAFPDHHAYREDEVMRICEAAAGAGAVPVTTAKDAVRLPPAARGMVEVLTVTVEWSDPDALADLLRPVLAAARGGNASRDDRPTT